MVFFIFLEFIVSSLDITHVKPGMKISITSPGERKPEVMWVENIDILPDHTQTYLCTESEKNKVVTLLLHNKKGKVSIRTTVHDFRNSHHKLYHIS